MHRIEVSGQHDRLAFAATRWREGFLEAYRFAGRVSVSRLPIATLQQ